MYFGFVRSVIDKTHVRGVSRKTGKCFEEVLDFSELSLQELLYSRIPSFISKQNKEGYIKEYLPSNLITVQ